MYRPEGWIDGRKIYDTEKKGVLSDADIYEAGGDAMLEGLKAEGWRLKGESVVPAQGEFPEIHIPEKLKGYLVFIPDEEKNEG